MIVCSSVSTVDTSQHGSWHEFTQEVGQNGGFGSLGANTATYFLDTVLTACQFM